MTRLINRCSKGRLGWWWFLQLALVGTVTANQPEQLRDELSTEVMLNAPLKLVANEPAASAQPLGDLTINDPMPLADIRFINNPDTPLLIERGRLDKGLAEARGALTLKSVAGIQSRVGGEFMYSDFNTVDSVEPSRQGWVDTETVSELKAQTYLFSNWTPPAHSNLDLQGGAAVEYLEIERDGDATLSRIYAYLKPRLELSYKASSSQQWLLGVERTVGESGFGLINNASTVEIWRANPDLEPQTAWEFVAQYRHYYLNELGSLKLRAFYNQLEDVIDEVAVSETESAPGNIGSGYLRGLRLDTDVTLWGGVKASVAMVYQQSQVTDPFVNKKRSLNNVSDQQISMGLYKSFELVPLATGISYLQQSDYHNQRVNELNKISQSQGYLDTYLEWVLPGDISMRFDVKNVLNNTVVTRRTSYQLSTSDGQVGATELLTSQAGRFWGFSMSGKI